MKMYVLVFLSLILLSCSEHEEQVMVPDKDWTQENSSDMNTTFVAEEEDEIDLFVKRHEDWKMTKTGTGLRHFIYKKQRHCKNWRISDG